MVKRRKGVDNRRFFYFLRPFSIIVLKYQKSSEMSSDNLTVKKAIRINIRGPITVYECKRETFPYGNDLCEMKTHKVGNLVNLIVESRVIEKVLDSCKYIV